MKISWKMHSFGIPEVCSASRKQDDSRTGTGLNPLFRFKSAVTNFFSQSIIVSSGPYCFICRKEVFLCKCLLFSIYFEYMAFFSNKQKSMIFRLVAGVRLIKNTFYVFVALLFHLFHIRKKNLCMTQTLAPNFKLFEI